MSPLVLRGFLFAVASLLILAGPVASADADSSVYEVVTEPTLEPGMAIPKPSGPVVLRVSGRISVAPNSGDAIAFDLPTLERLGLVRFTTPTNWTEGPTTFDGVLLSRLLDLVGADAAATTLVLTALNDYDAPMPISDARKWPVVLALKENGEYMSRRKHGPLWVVYPQQAFPELGGREYLARWVWQLAKITVQ